jgi:UDP-glucose 4-epimerase
LRFDQATAADIGYSVINLGTAAGTTVRELVDIYRAVAGEVEVVVGTPRPGDAAGCFPRSGKAKAVLDWAADLSLSDAILDAIAWRERRPAILGY